MWILPVFRCKVLTPKYPCVLNVVACSLQSARTPKPISAEQRDGQESSASRQVHCHTWWLKEIAEREGNVHRGMDGCTQEEHDRWLEVHQDAISLARSVYEKKQVAQHQQSHERQRAAELGPDEVCYSCGEELGVGSDKTLSCDGGDCLNSIHAECCEPALQTPSEDDHVSVQKCKSMCVVVRRLYKFELLQLPFFS